MATRAAPLAPDARRASIIAATLPLLREHGPSVTTAQIAIAARVAEGTLFRAFPDKDALIHATIQAAFDPQPTEAKLAAIDPGWSLRAKMIAAVEILKARVEQVWQLMTSFGIMVPPQRTDVHSDQGIRDQLAAIFAAHPDELRCGPAYAMRVLRSLTFAGTHPRISDNQPLSAEEIVSIVLDGLRKEP